MSVWNPLPPRRPGQAPPSPERDEALAERDAIRADRIARGLDPDRPSQGLACPVCHETFAFGVDCPECGVGLVQASLVDVATPDPPFYRGGARPLHMILMSFGAALVSIITILWLLWRTTRNYDFW